MMTKRMLLVLAMAMFAGACGGTNGGEAPSAEGGGAPADSTQSDNTSGNGAHTGG
jgi:ABC-type glycerol-3-phosphate transport system substrate-binding protein